MQPRERFLRSFAYDSHFEQWKGRLRIAWWGCRRLEVWVEAGENGPSDAHLEALEAIRAYRGNLREQFQEKVHAYYTGHAHDVLDDPPKLTHPSQVWKLLDPATLVVLPPTPDAVVFLLIMECAWDEEHGLGVRFKNWSIVDVGGQSDVSYPQ